MLAMVEQSRAVPEHAGVDASRRLAERLEQVGTKIEWLAAQLAAQDAASQTLVNTLSARLVDIDTQITTIGRSGDEHGGRLTQSLAGLKNVAQALQRELEQGQQASEAMIGKAQEMGAVLTGVATQLREDLPPALTGVELQAAHLSMAAEAALPSIEAIQAAAALAAASLSDGESSVNRQREALEALLTRAREGTEAAEEQLRALIATMEKADSEASRLAQDAGPQLVEALVRVRETANQAATHAREAIAAIVPDSAAALAQASREAVVGAVTNPVQAQIAEISAAAERATEVARQASERLTRQLLVMGETAVAIEARISDDEAAREERGAENLTRRVSLLIEALNSTAIDVNKILSNEVDDTAWTAYLKGDRGVFTRRAVRLLDSGEAREIQRHYEGEPDFRDQVNRYVHDFEAMLRRVLPERDGATLGVTLLSSDMGKLYVALAQAIERLRRFFPSRLREGTEGWGLADLKSPTPTLPQAEGS
jgi:hypothetical protein